MLDNNKFLKSPLVQAIGLSSALLAAGAQAAEFQLEEIVVTAQKRAESLQDVPISVSAVGGEKLSEAGIENLQDLSTYVPNLKIIEGALVPQMFIRGIGSSANQGFEQSVGTFSDGIYMGRGLQSRTAFLDLERVEVLRGPQGILFGQSTIAGAISLVSGKPQQETEGYISIGHVPQYDETEVNGYITGPLTDTLSARFAFRDKRENGYLNNRLRDSESMDTEEQSGRLSLLWEPNDVLSALLKVESTRVDRSGRLDQPIDTGIYSLAVPSLAEDSEFDYNIRSNEDTRMEFDSDNIALTLEYQLGDHTLTSITAHSTFDFHELDFDPDATEIQVLVLDMFEDFEQTSQEFRLTSPGGETVDYIVGLFYQDSEQEYTENVDGHLSTLGLNPALDTLIAHDFNQDSETFAAFTQVTWNITEELRATFGLRYSRDEKEGERRQTLTSLNNPGVSQSDVDITLPIVGTVSAADILAWEDDGSPFSGLRANDHFLEGDSKETNWTPSVNLQYDLNEDVMLYITYSEGYKAGGFDARGINNFTAGDADTLGRNYGVFALGADTFEFGQEEAETLEIGAKMTLLDGAAELNVALFQTDYTDMQVSVYDGTYGFAVLNAGESTVRGLEMDGRWRTSESVTLTASLAYLDFEWTKFEEGPCPSVGHNTPSPSGDNCDYEGLENNHTPEWTANVSANHIYPLSDSLELSSTLDLNFKDNHYVANNLDARSEQPGTTLINARIALSSLEDDWQVALVGKNLSDQKVNNYSTNLIQSQGGLSASIGRPRTVGIEANYRF